MLWVKYPFGGNTGTALHCRVDMIMRLFFAGKMSSPAWRFQMGDPARFSASPSLGLSALLAILLPMLISRLL